MILLIDNFFVIFLNQSRLSLNDGNGRFLNLDIGSLLLVCWFVKLGRDINICLFSAEFVSCWVRHRLLRQWLFLNHLILSDASCALSNLGLHNYLLLRFPADSLNLFQTLLNLLCNILLFDGFSFCLCNLLFHNHIFVNNLVIVYYFLLENLLWYLDILFGFDYCRFFGVLKPLEFGLVNDVEVLNYFDEVWLFDLVD